MSDSRKAWSNQEDHAITTLVKKHGTHRWSEISKRMLDHFGPPGRTGKQCRERWHNHLNPKINKSAWTEQQQRILFQCHQSYGNKWKTIAQHLKGRTDNDIKNKFYSSMRKKLRKVNKLLGVKNSTSQVREIKPKVLSNIISAASSNDIKIQQAWQQLSKLLFCRDDRKLQKLVKGEEKSKIVELIETISSLNENYVENKDIQKVQLKKTEDQQIKVERVERSKRKVLRRKSSSKILENNPKSEHKISSSSQNLFQSQQHNFNFSLNFSDIQSPGFSSFTPVLAKKQSIISNLESRQNENCRDFFASPRFTRSFLRTPNRPTPGTHSNPSFGLDIKAGQFGKPQVYEDIRAQIKKTIVKNSQLGF